MSGPQSPVTSAGTTTIPAAVDPLVQEADDGKWDSSKVPEYDGTNFRQWDRYVTGEFLNHNAEWILEKRLPGDKIVHKRALVFIRRSVDVIHDHLIDDCEDVFKIYKNIVAHHKAWLRINLPRLQEELAMIRQQVDETSTFYLSR
jgi:hypothetical protein